MTAAADAIAPLEERSPRSALPFAAAAVVTLIGGLPRLLLAAGMLPDPLRPFVWSDGLLVYERGLSGHRLPYADSPFEYPPLIGAISGLFSLLSPGPAVFVALWIAMLAIAAGSVAAMLGPLAKGRMLVGT